MCEYIYIIYMTYIPFMKPTEIDMHVYIYIFIYTHALRTTRTQHAKNIFEQASIPN